MQQTASGDPELDVNEFITFFKGSSHNYGYIYTTEISEDLYRQVTYHSIYSFTAPQLTFRLRQTFDDRNYVEPKGPGAKRRTIATASPYDFHGLVEPNVDWQQIHTIEGAALNDATFNGKITEEDIKFTGRAKVFNSSLLSTRPHKKRALPEANYKEESPILEDPVFKEIAQEKTKANIRVFASAKALAAISVVNRSVCPFELIFKKDGINLWVYQRTEESPAIFESSFETITIPVNQRRDDTREEFLRNLVEASNIAAQFQAAANSGDGPTFTLGDDLEHPGDDDDSKPYLYRRLVLDNVEFIIRAEIDCLRDPLQPGERPSIAICRTFNNLPTSLRQVSYATDLEKARSSLLLAEVKDNSNIFAKWVAIGRFMDCQQIFLGFVERKVSTNKQQHVLLASERQAYGRGASIITLPEASMMGQIYQVFQKMIASDDGIYHFQRDSTHRVVKIFKEVKDKVKLDEE